MISAKPTLCECGARMIRCRRANGLPGYVLECSECPAVRVFDGDGREINLATGGFRRSMSGISGKCACAGCGQPVKVKGLCTIHNSRWAGIKLPRFGDTYKKWIAAGGPTPSKWKAMA